MPILSIELSFNILFKLKYLGRSIKKSLFILMYLGALAVILFCPWLFSDIFLFFLYQPYYYMLRRISVSTAYKVWLNAPSRYCVSQIFVANQPYSRYTVGLPFCGFAGH